MKKIIIAAALACAAAVTQASTVNWGLTGAVDTDKFASGTAYLICVDDLARPTSLTAETAGDWYKANASTVASAAFRTATVSNGAIYETEVIESPTGRKNYWIIIDNNAANDADHYFAVSTSQKALNIQSGTMNQTAAWTASTQMSTYHAAVPEPTSGLLLLLGMAGLALKRKRA